MSRWRIGILITLVLGLIVGAELLGVRACLSLDGLRSFTARAGAWGVVLFLAAFCAAHLAYLPGMMFVVASVLSYGQLWGGILGWVGAVLAVSATFVVVRTIGGTIPATVNRPRLQKLLATLEKRPIRTIIVLRLVFWLAPALNYALAFSRLRFRDFVIGSAVGLVAPIGVATLFIERIAAYLSR
jgi:uncharacterized membrane protein YdjX (TVP38/TMEM64 family)